ncbi:MAG TPA: hypothetical protein VMV92_28925 [Streptosporangiaceae bacterium]|nr:hypothetical protein [Streptosporangiaceae bacterium]
MSGEAASFGSVGLYAGADWTVRCHAYPVASPILAVDAGRTSVCISIRNGVDMPDAGVEFARELARRAQQFAAECERLHAARTTGGNGDDPGRAAARDIAGGAA